MTSFQLLYILFPSLSFRVYLMSWNVYTQFLGMGNYPVVTASKAVRSVMSKVLVIVSYFIATFV